MPNLSPPFGDSTSIASRRGLEGVTFLILMVGLPVVTVTALMITVICYYYCKKYQWSYACCDQNGCKFTRWSESYESLNLCETLTASCKGIRCTVTTGGENLKGKGDRYKYAKILAGVIAFGPIWGVVLFVAGAGAVAGCIGVALAVIILLTLFSIRDCLSYFIDRCCGALVCIKPGAHNERKPMRYERTVSWLNPPLGGETPSSEDEFDGPVPVDVHRLFARIVSLLPFSVISERVHSESDFHQKAEVFRLFADRMEPKSPLWKLWTYTYFLSMFILSIFWFLVIFIDNLWYRKVTTCNDVNVEGNDFACYAITEDKHNFDVQACIDPINGSVVQDPGKVICYILLSSPGTALGVAVGVAKFMITIPDVAFHVSLKLSDYHWGRIFLAMVQTLGFVLPIAFLISISIAQAAFGKSPSALRWFLYGFVPMRIFMFVLTTITIPIAVMVPWWAFHNDPEFKTVSRQLDPERPEPKDDLPRSTKPNEILIELHEPGQGAENGDYYNFEL